MFCAMIVYHCYICVYAVTVCGVCGAVDLLCAAVCGAVDLLCAACVVQWIYFGMP